MTRRREDWWERRGGCGCVGVSVCERERAFHSKMVNVGINALKKYYYVQLLSGIEHKKHRNRDKY